MIRSTICMSLFVVACMGATIVRNRRPFAGGRIVGGQPTDISNHPYQLSFEFFEAHHCGAAIISENWAISAGHCVDSVDENFISLRAGTTLLETEGSVHEVSLAKIHPDFDYYTLDYDVALLQVSTPFVEGPNVQPIALASEEPAPGSAAVVTGWGSEYSGGPMSSVLLEVTVHVVDRNQCNDAYANQGGITVNMFCAGEEEGGKDSCKGDSGGPLVVDGKLAGIVSWGVGCAVRGYPGIYSNVVQFKDFVSSTTTS